MRKCWSRWLANGFLAAVEVRCAPQAAGLPGIALPGAICFLAIGVADLPLFARLVAASLVVLRLGIEWRTRWWPHGPGYVRRVMWLPGGLWRLETADGAVMARLAHAWGCSRGPVIGMEWICENGRRYQAWLWRHGCPAPHWRRLRVHLRMT